ncbi:ABC transporter permease subunit [Iocasia frigidifontis]|uniref:ABC transporter permease subunit n=1 Tax=Iocasia fonsfrigidae TaxID=2682810 RepID=A0A8A7KPC8_9FIRM|nr:ABC transporter permease subunit [Iocasia fonsfrigidae]QTL99662.1 ABC transporter permease subunit [Iocasia fonsfrigidae]
MNRYQVEKVFKLLTFLSFLVVMFSLIIIIVITLIKGGGVLLGNPALVITPPGPKYLLGGKGGFLHALLGSIYLVLPATLLAITLALLIASYLQTDYLKRSYANKIRVLLEILWGTPSIVLGIFVMTILVFIKQRGSLLAGIMALTLLELPIITRYTDEAISSVPNNLKEAVYSMGTTKLESSLVVIRYALPGIVAGVLIGLGRGIGDAATIIFTAGSSSSMPQGLFDSVTALPILIFQQASAFHAKVRADAYAASFVLLVIIIILNVLSRLSIKYFSRYIQDKGN